MESARLDVGSGCAKLPLCVSEGVCVWAAEGGPDQRCGVGGEERPSVLWGQSGTCGTGHSAKGAVLVYNVGPTSEHSSAVEQETKPSSSAK